MPVLLILVLSLGILATAVFPSMHKFYRQAVVEYEAEHLLTEIRRAQSVARLMGENTWGYGKESQWVEKLTIDVYSTSSVVTVKHDGKSSTTTHDCTSRVHFRRLDPRQSAISIGFDENGALKSTNAMMTILIYYEGFPQEGRRIMISRGGRIRLERGGIS